MKISKSLFARITVGIAVPVIAVFGTWFLKTYKSGPPCPFFRLTGLYCPGCGAGRASVALLDFDLASAFGNNLFFVIFLPFVLYYLVKVYIRYVFGKDIIPFFKIGTKTAVALLVAVISFWILRNIPVFPFTVLAPIAI